MSSTHDPAALAFGTEAPLDNVRGAWPANRIETLRRMARDTSEPDDVFQRSKRLAWMREFCLDAPSWLQTTADHERLRLKAQAALGSCRAAAAQVQAVLDHLDGMVAPPNPELDRWAEAVAAVPRETLEAQVQPKPPVSRPAMRQVHLEEAIAEADARAKNAPKGPMKKPAPGEKLPGEKAWDAAHGLPTSGPSKVDLRGELAKLQRNDPNFTRRVLGKAAITPAGPAAPAKPTPAAPAPTDEVPKKRVRKPYKMSPEARARRNARSRQFERDKLQRRATPELKAFLVELDRAKEVAGCTKTGRRLALITLRRMYGEEVAHFIAHGILGSVVSTTALYGVINRFMGTFPSRLAAEESCANHYGPKAIAELRAGKDVLARHAGGLTLEHGDGRCSWFRT